MITLEEWRGKEQVISFAVDAFIARGLGRQVTATATAASKKLKAPDARNLRKGPFQFRVINVGATTFALCDNAGTSLGNVAANQVADLHLAGNSSAAGVWYARIRNKL